jgi:hypothetical protein
LAITGFGHLSQIVETHFQRTGIFDAVVFGYFPKAQADSRAPAVRAARVEDALRPWMLGKSKHGAVIDGIERAE